jgi:hypothetical protein
MVTRRRALLGGAALAAAGVVAGIVLLALAVSHGGNGGSQLPNGVPIAVQGTIAPTVAFFGDAIQARLDVAVDRRKAGPDRVRIATDFRPFERLATQRTRRHAGRITYIRQTYTIRCLARQCLQVLPSVAAAAGGAQVSGRRATLFRPARVYVTGRSTVSPLLVQWPTVETLTRVNQSEARLQTFFYHASLTPPDPTYAVAPRTLLGLLVLGILVALAIPVALVLRRLQQRRRARLSPRAEEAGRLGARVRSATGGNGATPA